MTAPDILCSSAPPSSELHKAFQSACVWLHSNRCDCVGLTRDISMAKGLPADHVGIKRSAGFI